MGVDGTLLSAAVRRFSVVLILAFIRAMAEEALDERGLCGRCAGKRCDALDDTLGRCDALWR